MKVISVWQPWATLQIAGFKIFETRTWPAPKSIIGQRIGIAATKNIIPDQRSACAEESFARFYEMTGLPPLEELPRGVLLGTAQLHSVEPVTSEFLEEITDEERAFGWYMPGGYAWRMRDPKPLAHPIPIQGKQGIFDWKGFDNGTQEEANVEEKVADVAAARNDQGYQGSPLRPHLYLA